MPAQSVMAVSVPADASPSAGPAGLGVLSCEISPGLVDEVPGIDGLCFQALITRGAIAVVSGRSAASASALTTNVSGVR